MSRALVVYHSGTGNTRAMAQAVAEGVKTVAGVEVILKEAEQVSVNDLVDADAIAFGSPTYFSYMAGTLKTLFDKAWPSRNEIEGKPFVAFTSGAGSQAKSLQSIESVGSSCGLQKACSGVAVAGMPTDSQKEACRSLGAALAKAIKK
jgi:NAD(P)H dehydrogenase (quinone)